MVHKNAFLIASSQSGGGKTTVTLGLLAAIKQMGLSVQPCKCGPDFIDPEFHEAVTGEVSLNLDTWMMGTDHVKHNFYEKCSKADATIVEGVMGLYDGASPKNLIGSSADIARLLSLPVILVVDAKGMAGSIAPLVKGFTEFHPEVTIVGVIANRVGSKNHGELLSKALSAANLPPLLGAVPYNRDIEIPERHLGLKASVEVEKDKSWISAVASHVEEHVNISLLLKKTGYSPKPVSHSKRKSLLAKSIAIAKDEAFHFYYQQNEDYLRALGYNITYFSPLHDNTLPKVDLLYIGGGFPESYAEKLEANTSMREAIRSYAESGCSIYAECGGYVYLCKTLMIGDESFAMADVINGTAKLYEKRQALGYRSYTLKAALPFLQKGSGIRGHEFHYTNISLHQEYNPLFTKTDSRGNTTESGINWKGVQAGYQHLFFPGYSIESDDKP